MGIVYLFCVAIMFSFVGSFVKLISPYFTSQYISLFRFVFAIVFLFILKIVKKHHFQQPLRDLLKKYGGWLIFGGVTKAMAYLTENYGLTHGLSYGNILVQPAQVLFLTFISIVVFQQKITRKKALFLAPCLIGILLISWNGRPLGDFFANGAGLMLLFLISGVFAGCHVLAQKKVAASMDIIDSNLIMFSFSAIVALIPVIGATANGAIDGIHPDFACFIASIAIGFITGIAFYLNAKAIPLVPFYMVPIIQSSMVIFAITWGVIFFHEPCSMFVICGTLMFIVGVIGLQLADVKLPHKAAK